MNSRCFLLNLSNRNVTRQLISNSIEDKNTAFLKKNNFINSRSHISNTLFSTDLNPDNWSKILIKAEKVVGYPTSFLNLRYLVSDEVAHFAQLLRYDFFYWYINKIPRNWYWHFLAISTGTKTGQFINKKIWNNLYLII